MEIYLLYIHQYLTLRHTRFASFRCCVADELIQLIPIFHFASLNLRFLHGFISDHNSLCVVLLWFFWNALMTQSEVLVYHECITIPQQLAKLFLS